MFLQELPGVGVVLRTEKLVVVRPNTRYGAVVNKKTQTMTVYENGKKLTNRGGNYICVNGKWIERFRYYECGEKEDCDRTSIRCQSSPAIGTACDNEGVPAEFDGCTLICSGGAYLYAPPPW